jgi:wyosine [tRNA(Phe)-imidazoG37] synthetase (radical SAM superfamily)
MDCIFCQLGRTPKTTVQRAEYVPIEKVLGELEEWISEGGRADHITLAGSGEPTLHVEFGEVFRWVKNHTQIPTVLLTNGSLLYLPEVRRDAAFADKVKITMSAWDEESFQKMHRTHAGISFERLMEGEEKFSAEYNGELSVEVFLVEGVNTSEESLKKMAERAATLKPDRIDLNTAIRPAAESSVRAISLQKMKEIAALFGEKAVVSASYPAEGEGRGRSAPSTQALLDLLARHPATLEQLAVDFSTSQKELLLHLTKLLQQKKIAEEIRDKETYYFSRSLD